MNIIQRITLYQFSLMLVFLIAISGCQNANNTITPESSLTNLQSDSLQVDAERRTPQTSPAEKEVTTTDKPTDKVAGKSEEIEKRSSAELQKNMISRWSNIMGHGGMPQDSSAAEEEMTTTGQSGEIEKGSFVELEEKVIGRWLNIKETESIEFFDGGAVVIIDKRGLNPKMRGKYRFVDNDHLIVVFAGGFYAKLIPPMSFRISISENEITLTDEPDGAATTYKRIK